MFDKQKFLLLKDLSALGPHRYNLIPYFKKNKAMICGGAILSVFTETKINDYDIYFRTFSDAYSMIKDLEKISYLAKVFTTENAVTFKSKELTIQIICGENLFGNSPMDLIDKFDFSVCMGAYDFNTDLFTVDKNFFTSIANHKLIFNVKVDYPICSMIRLLKYQEKGYSIEGTELMKLILCINKVNINNYKELRRQLLGIDTILMEQFYKYLMTIKTDTDIYDFDEFILIYTTWISNQYKSVLGGSNG